MSKRSFQGLCLVFALLGVGCARPFVPVTPSGFVEIEDPNQEGYDYRATHPDGVVTSVKVLENAPEGDLGFWSRAVENELRQFRGYALLEKRPIRSADGISGQQLRFGHDESTEPHLYTVSLFVDEDDVFVLEQGGKAELVKAHSAALDSVVSGFRVRSGLSRFFSYGGR